MRVFVTGATGFVGSAVVAELISQGYTVTGLARSEASAAKLEALGVVAHPGSLEDLDSLRSGAASADAVVHTAFNHDFSQFAANSEAERQAIAALGSVLEGTGKPLIVTSGAGLAAAGDLATEFDRAPSHSSMPRTPEASIDDLAGRGVRAMVVRLPPSVHGAGDHGFVPALIGIAMQKGAAAYIGEGTIRWSGVHRLDAARVYRLAIEKGEAGDRFHAVADEGVPFRALAELIARRLGLPAISISPEETAGHFGWMAPFVAMNRAASSAWTRARLDWEPVQPGLLEDLDSDAYFGS